MSRQTQSYDDKAIRGEELESLATSIAQKIVDNGQVVAEALDELDARTRALENRNPDVLGDAVADSLDAQVLKIGGQPIDTSAFEQVSNKVSSWQTTPDNTHYPSEKLVKGSLDAKADANKVVAIADALVKRGGGGNSTFGWFKVAEKSYASGTLSNTICANWAVTIFSASKNIAVSFNIDLNLRTGTSGQNVGVRLFRTSPIGVLTSEQNVDNFKIAIQGTSENFTMTLWYYAGGSNESMAIRELESNSFVGTKQKFLWTYFSPDGAPDSTTEPTATTAKNLEWLYAKTTQTAVTDPTASGTALSFIDSISQNENGEITATKKSVAVDSTPTASSTNLMTSGGIKTALDGKQDSLPTSGTASSTYAINISGNANTARSLQRASGSSAGKSRYAKLFTIQSAYVDNLAAGLVIAFTARDSNNNNKSGFLRLRFANNSESGYVTILNSGSVGNAATTRLGFLKVASGKYEVWAALTIYSRISAYVVACDDVSFTAHSATYETTMPEGLTLFTNGLNVTKADNQAAVGSASIPTYVDSDGEIKACTVDSTPTDSSTNMVTSGGVKTALDNAVANNNKRYPFGVRQNRTTSYGYRLFNVKFSTAQSANRVRISGNIVVGTTGDNEHISFDLVIANVNTVENNPSAINLITTSTRRGSRVVRLAYKRPSNWADGLDVFILWNAEGTATATNDTYGWEITQQEATLSSGVEVKDENLTSALTGFTLDMPRTAAITEGTSAIGSTSVPVYANANGEIKACTDDFVHDGDVAQTYSSSSTAPISGKGVKAAVDSLSSTQIPIGLKYDMVLANETSTTPTLCYEISNIGLNTNYSAATAELVVYQYAAQGTAHTNIPSYKVVVHWDRTSAICIVEGLNPTGTWTAVVENSTTPASTDVTTLKLYFKPIQYRTYRMSVVSCKLRGTSRESYITDGTIVVKKVTQEIPTASTLVIVGTTTVKTLICDKNVTSTYSATGTDPVNGTAVASAISTKQDTLSFMSDTEAHSLWTNAKANAS